MLPPDDRALDLLAEEVGDALQAAMERRRSRQRDFSDSKRRAIQRALAGNNLTLKQLTRLAALLNCRVHVQFIDAPATRGDIDVSSAASGVKVEL